MRDTGLRRASLQPPSASVTVSSAAKQGVGSGPLDSLTDDAKASSKGQLSRGANGANGANVEVGCGVWCPCIHKGTCEHYGERSERPL